MCMFSATWPENVKILAKSYMNNPVHLQIGILDNSINHNIIQKIEFLNQSQKSFRFF